MGSAAIGGWGTGHAGGIDIPLADPGARAVCRRCHREVNAASVVDGLCMTCRGCVAEPGGRIPERLMGVCPECGREFRPEHGRKTCSPECARERNRRTIGEHRGR